LGAIVVAGIIAFIIWWKEEHGGRGLGSQTLKYSYIVSAVMFILGLKGLSSPKWARRGMQLAALGMLLAVLGTLFDQQIVNYRWIILGFITGSVIGGGMGLRIPMTAVPQRTALSHSLGALAACLVGVAEFILFQDINRVKLTALDFEVVVGALTFTGSLIAAAKLQELLPGRPITYKGQNILSITTIGVVAAIGIFLVVAQTQSPLFYLMVGRAFVRPHVGYTHRCGGHADGDRVAQLIRGVGGRLNGFCPDEQNSDHYGIAGWHLGLSSGVTDVSSNESFGDERVIRCLWASGIGRRSSSCCRTKRNGP
jgi:hypothetical protein